MRRTVTLLGIVVALFVFAFRSSLAQETPGPRLVRFSGVLDSPAGFQIGPGIQSVSFAIYRDQHAGSALWLETQNVMVDSLGRFAAHLGAGTQGGLPLDLFAAGESRWLGMQVNRPDSIEQPRVLIVSVPYALKAADAETLGGKPLSAFVLADDNRENNQKTEQASEKSTDSEGRVTTSNADNTVPKYNPGGAGFIDSSIVDDGTTVTIGEPVTISAGTGVTVSVTATSGLTVTSSVFAQSLNNVRLCDQFAGATAGDKIEACIDDLVDDYGDDGGIADARGLVGDQTIPETITIAKPITLLLGAATLTFTGSTPMFALSGDGAGIECLSPKASILSIPAFGKDGVVFGGDFNFIRNCTVRGPGDGTDSAGWSAIDADGGDGVEVIGNTLEDWGSHCLNTGGLATNWTISRNTVRNCRHDGLLVGGGATGMLVTDNWVYEIGSWALDCNCANSTWSRNHVRNSGGIFGPLNDGGGIAVFGVVSGNYTWNADGNIFSDNEVIGSTARGIQIASMADSSASNNLIIGNVFEETDGHHMFVTGGGGSELVGNRFISNTCSTSAGTNTTGLFLQATLGATISKTKIINNVCNDNDYGIVVEAGATDTEVKDNDVFNNGTQAIYDAGTRTKQVGNNDSTSDSIYDIKSQNLLAGSFFGTGLHVKSAGNTEVRLESSQVSSEVWTNFIDQYGNYHIYNVTDSAPRLSISGAGGVSIPAGVTVGSGGANLNNMRAAGLSLDFPSTAAGASSDLTGTLTGCEDSYPVIVGPPAGNGFGGGLFFAWCSGTDTATVRFYNPTGSSIDPSSGSYVVAQFRF